MGTITSQTSSTSTTPLPATSSSLNKTESSVQPKEETESFLFTPPHIILQITPQLKTKINSETEFIVKQGKPNDSEITLEVDITLVSTNKIIALLQAYKVDIIATSQFIKSKRDVNYIWVNDSGNAVKNAVKAQLFGKAVTILPERKPRGKKRIVFKQLMTNKEFIETIQQRFNQDQEYFIAHSPIISSGLQFILY